MTKKATKERSENFPHRSARQVPGPAQEVAPPVSIEDLNLNATILAAQKQVFKSEQEALDFFYARLLQAAGGSAAEQAQMMEFLELLIETDPLLKEELLSGVTIRK